MKYDIKVNSINFYLYFVEIEPELEIKSTESYHIQNTYSKKKSNNGDFDSEYDNRKSNNEYDIIDNDKKSKNRDSFRKNKSTVYGTVKNQRRNTKGIFNYTMVSYIRLYNFYLFKRIMMEKNKTFEFHPGNTNDEYMTQNEKMRNKKERGGFNGSPVSKTITKYLVGFAAPVFILFITNLLLTSSNPYAPYPSLNTMQISYLIK